MGVVFQINPTESPERFEISVPETWGQGRAVYGGLAGAYLMMGATAGVSGSARSATISFVGPLESGPATLKRRVLREGSSMTHLQTEIEQNGEVKTIGLFAFGEARKTGLDIVSEPLVLPAPDTLHTIDFGQGLAPEFTSHFEYKWSGDAFPLSGAAARAQGWVRSKSELEFLSPEAHSMPASILALIDAWPPAIWSALTFPARGSTATWSVAFTPEAHKNITSTQWFSYDAKSTFSQEGYADTEATFGDGQGRVLAKSRQVFSEFSKASV